MVQVGNLSAWITIGDAKVVAEEYDVTTVVNPTAHGKENGALITTCWIASQVREKFGISWKDTTGGPHRLTEIASYYILDGINVGGTRCAQGIATDLVHERDDVRTGPTTAKKFVFGCIELTDDDAAGGTAAAQNIGDIMLEIWDVRMVAAKRPPVHAVLPDCSDKVHERAKKGSAHRVQFGQDIKIPYSTCVQVKRISLKHRVIFKYRPIDILLANGIAPPAPAAHVSTPPPPSPAGQASAVAPELDEDVDEGEEKALKARLAALAVKKAAASGSGTKRVKTESQSASSRGPISLGTIDLTLDDDGAFAYGKRKRSDDGVGGVKREKKPRIKEEDHWGGTIDLT